MTLSRWKHLWRNWFRRSAVEADLDEEVRAYVEMAANEQTTHGAAAYDPRRAILVEIGGAEHLKQQIRQERIGAGLASIAQDLRFGLRQVKHAPGFGFTVVLALALSVGVATAVFSVLYAMILRPLPYRELARIVALDTRSAGGGSQAASWPEYADWRRLSRSFTALAGFTESTVGLESESGPVALHAVQTTDNFFEVFGVGAIAGRTFARGEDQPGKNDVVVLSYEIWQQDFAGREVIGKTVRLDAKPYIILGVMPAGFRFPIQSRNAVYVPLHLTPSQKDGRGNHWLNTVALLKPGVSSRQAEADLQAVFTQLGKDDAFNAGRSVHAVDLTTWVVGDSSHALYLLSASVLAIIIIGCVNVAALLLARGVKREREIALRSALGADRARIVRQLVTEALIFAAAGAAGGSLLAFALLGTIRMLLVAALARGAEVTINLPVLLAAVVTSATVTVAAALIPAMRLSGTAPAKALKSGGNAGTSHWQHRLRAGFVITQVALALTLLVVSGLLLAMFRHLRDTQLGFNPAQVLTAEVDLPHGRYEKRDLLVDFYQPLMDRIGVVPGVQATGLISMLPGSGWGWNSEHVHIYGTEPLKNPRTEPAEVRFVTPGYYEVFADRLVEGRLADPRIDKPTTRLVCVVNEAFVKKFIPPGRDPVGMEIGDNDQNQTMPNQDNPRALIVGVVKNLRQTIYQPPFPEMDYMIAQIPAAQSMNAIGSMHLVVRAAGNLDGLVSPLRQVFRQVDATIPLREPQTMNSVIADTLQFEQLENWLFGSFAVVSVLLALVGLYGLIGHEVELSTREIGIRLALGASREVIRRQIFRRVGWMLGVGVTIGLAVTVATQRLINAVVTVHVEQGGALIAALAMGLVLAGWMATAVPVRRAARIQPIEALRDE